MRNLDFAIHLSDNLIQISQSYFDGKTFHINKLVETQEVYPIFSNQSEKGLIDESKLIEKLVKDAQITSKNVRIVIPDSDTFSQIIDFPLLSEKELISAVKYQAEQIIPLPIEEAAIDLSVIEENKKEKKTKVLVVAAPINLINFLTRLIEESGLIPEVIENEISSFSRFITEISPPQTKNPIIYYNFGDHSSFLYYYHPEKNLITDIYNFNVGYLLFNKELRLNLNFDNQKAVQVLKDIGIDDNAQIKSRSILSPVINEITKNLNIFSELLEKKYHLSKINQIYFLNQSFLVKNLEKEISQKTNCQCSPLIVPTKPAIPNSQALVFNFSQYQKR